MPCIQLLFPMQILRYLNCCHILYSNGTDLKLGSSTYFVQLYSFLVHTKCQDLNLRAGRSRDLVMFKPSFNNNKTSLAVNFLVWPCVTIQVSIGSFFNVPFTWKFHEGKPILFVFLLLLLLLFTFTYELTQPKHLLPHASFPFLFQFWKCKGWLRRLLNSL